MADLYLIFANIYPHSLIQQRFSEPPLWARHCDRRWGEDEFTNAVLPLNPPASDFFPWCSTPSLFHLIPPKLNFNPIAINLIKSIWRCLYYFGFVPDIFQFQCNKPSNYIIKLRLLHSSTSVLHFSELAILFKFPSLNFSFSLSLPLSHAHTYLKHIQP